MNKEQFIATLQACYFGDKGAYNLILKEYKKTHNKIDKAIEYINQLEHSEWVIFGRKILLEILKGDIK